MTASLALNQWCSSEENLQVPLKIPGTAAEPSAEWHVTQGISSVTGSVLWLTGLCQLVESPSPLADVVGRLGLMACTSLESVMP